MSTFGHKDKAQPVSHPAIGAVEPPSTAAIGSATVNVATAPVLKVEVKRKKPYKSKVWHHFTQIKTNGAKTNKARCNYCNIEFAYKSVYGTSTLWKHLEKCTKYPFNNRRQKLLNFKNSA